MNLGIFLAFGSTFLFGQKKEEINFSDPIQIDSTAYYLIPKMVDNDDQKVYGKGKGYFPWGSYREIIFYNAKSNQTKKLFSGQIALIVPFLTRANYYNREKEEKKPANILPNHIIYLARIDDFNADNALNADDPVYLFISSKTGDSLRQVTPKGFHVISWTLSNNHKMILVKGQNDKNGNKKFGSGDDQLIYRIDLDDDISKITCYPISL